VTPDDLPRHLAAQSADYRTFFVLANRIKTGQPFVGRVNLTNAVRGRFRSVAMGYDAYLPYAGQGLFADGLRLVLDLAFATIEDGGMDLHRVEANVQPGNTRSAGLLRSLGFRHEGFSPRYLFLPDEQGVEVWRDHERYAITREEWPAEPYPAPAARRLVIRLTGSQSLPGQDLGRRLSLALGVPLLRADQPGLAVQVGAPEEQRRGADSEKLRQAERGTPRDLAVVAARNQEHRRGNQQPAQRPEQDERFAPVRVLQQEQAGDDDGAEGGGAPGTDRDGRRRRHRPAQARLRLGLRGGTKYEV
jgi:RimJ/RimL family protein N-acetyltransferase